MSLRPPLPRPRKGKKRPAPPGGKTPPAKPPASGGKC
jgi:hypothetical protein